MKQFQKLVFQPGINREGTNYSSEGFWWDCNRVRFRKGLPETIGGWTKHCDEPFVGVCRALQSWQLLTGEELLAVGTSKKLYIESSDTLHDITPVREEFTENDPITTGAISTSIVTLTTSGAHGALPGDFVIVSGAEAVDGIADTALNTEFEIVSVPSATTVTVDAGTACTAGSVTGGGAAVVLSFQITVGADTGSVGSGWGVGAWSRGAWSSASLTPYSSYDLMRIWSFANYGEDLIAAPFSKAMYYWDATSGLTSPAVLLSTLGGASGVPPEVGYVMVTAERHVIAFGATDLVSGVYDPMQIRWASQEAPADWTPTTLNTAGDYRLSLGDHIEAVSATRDEILVVTDVAVYSMRYSGPPFVFDIRQVADNISAAGPNAIVTLNNVTYWMGHYKFYMYNGTSQTIPCTVHRHVFENFNHAQARQVVAGHVEMFSEIWWFYPSAGSDHPDKYVVYNYADNIWFVGSLARTAWVKTISNHQLIAAGTDGHLYVQEFGTTDGETDPPSELGSFIQSSDFDIQDGTSFYFVERLIPDLRFNRSVAAIPEVHFIVHARDFPGEYYDETSLMTVKRTSDTPVDKYTKELWFRLRGRHLSLRVETDPDDIGTAWQLGHPRISVRTDGRR